MWRSVLALASDIVRATARVLPARCWPAASLRFSAAARRSTSTGPGASMYSHGRRCCAGVPHDMKAGARWLAIVLFNYRRFGNASYGGGLRQSSPSIEKPNKEYCQSRYQDSYAKHRDYAVERLTRNVFFPNAPRKHGWKLRSHLKAPSDMLCMCKVS
jgi:hypothetical protein